MASVAVDGGDPWRGDAVDVDDRLRDLDRRRRWPWVVGALLVVLAALVVRAAIPVVQDEVDRATLEVEQRRGDRPEEVVGDLIVMCVELTDPLRAHVDVVDSLDVVPEAVEVVRLLDVRLLEGPSECRGIPAALEQVLAPS